MRRGREKFRRRGPAAKSDFFEMAQHMGRGPAGRAGSMIKKDNIFYLSNNREL